MATLPTSATHGPAGAKRPAPAGHRIHRWLIGVAKRLVALGAIIGFLRVFGCTERLFYHPDRAPTPPPREASRVAFHSADGTRLCGWWFAARTSHDDPAPAAKRPTVIHIHGNAGNVADHIWFTNYLPSHGYNLFIFDYRGYGESEGSPRRRRDLIADAHAAIDYVLSRTDVNQELVGVYGQSLGGAIALNVVRDRREVRAAVIESSFTSWRDAAASVLSRVLPGALARYFAVVLIEDSMRPIDAIAAIDRPLLLIHGTADEIIPIEHGDALAAMAGAAAETLFLDGGEHNSLLDSHPELRHAVLAFLERTLSAGD
jgi:dipeptidyl aminopeptidase/acylaminoacyl peptidase